MSTTLLHRHLLTACNRRPCLVHLDFHTCSLFSSSSPPLESCHTHVLPSYVYDCGRRGRLTAPPVLSVNKLPHSSPHSSCTRSTLSHLLLPCSSPQISNEKPRFSTWNINFINARRLLSRLFSSRVPSGRVSTPPKNTTHNTHNNNSITPPPPSPYNMTTDTSSYDQMTLEALEALSLKQGESVRQLKAANAGKPVVDAEVEVLKLVKAALSLKLAEKKRLEDSKKFDRATFESVLTKRFFFAPSFQIYGGKLGSKERWMWGVGRPGQGRAT